MSEREWTPDLLRRAANEMAVSSHPFDYAVADLLRLVAGSMSWGGGWNANLRVTTGYDPMGRMVAAVVAIAEAIFSDNPEALDAS